MAILTKTYENGLRLCLDKTDKNVIGVNILFFVGSQNEQKHEEIISSIFMASSSKSLP